MDAQEQKPGSERFTRPLIFRLVAAWLFILLVLGLWQGYGVWLWSGSDVR